MTNEELDRLIEEELEAVIDEVFKKEKSARRKRRRKRKPKETLAITRSVLVIMYGHLLMLPVLLLNAVRLVQRIGVISQRKKMSL